MEAQHCHFGKEKVVQDQGRQGGEGGNNSKLWEAENIKLAANRQLV